MALFCETPFQSLAAAVAGGVAGGAAGLALGFGPAGVAALAGGLAGVGDVALHVVRRDSQFEEAVRRLRSTR
ncbi:MAG: hypothetical protein ACLFMT_05225 [Halobacteriales archaeon]